MLAKVKAFVDFLTATINDKPVRAETARTARG
jgi:hypothetical protein